MKKGIIISLAAIILVAGLFVFSSQYRDEHNANLETSAVYNGKEHTISQVSHDGVAAECKEAGYKLVIKGKKAFVIYGDYKRDLSSDYNSILEETPTFHYFDYDGDGKKDVILRILAMRTKELTGRKINKSYKLYCFEIRTESNGKSFLGYRVASDLMWKDAFENYITCEFTQLKSCEKLLQFAMNNKGEDIKYDEKTGLTDNKYSGYVAVAKSKLGEYYTMDKWSKGLGTYNIDDDGNITLDIQVLVQYEENQMIEEIGFIRCGVAYKRNQGFAIEPNTIVFIPRDEKRVSDPRNQSKSKWSAELLNLSQAPASETHTIDWIENSFDVSSIGESESRYFSEFDSQIKAVDSILFSQNGIVITAKENYGFSNRLVSSQSFKITAKLDGENDYDIGYKCSRGMSGSKETLTITFDRSYDKAELQDLSIYFAG